MVGVLGRCRPLLPYIVWEAGTGLGERTSSRRDYSAAPAKWRLEALDLALMNIGGAKHPSLAGAQRFRDFLEDLPDHDLLARSHRRGLVVSRARYWSAGCGASDAIGDGAAGRAFAALADCAGPVFPSIRGQDVLTHYLISLYPAPFWPWPQQRLRVLTARASGEIPTPLRLRMRLLRGRSAMACLWLGLVAWQTTCRSPSIRFVGTRHTPDGWGTPARILTTWPTALHKWRSAPVISRLLVLCPGAEPHSE